MTTFQDTTAKPESSKVCIRVCNKTMLRPCQGVEKTADTLTPYRTLLDNQSAVTHLTVGRGNLFIIGVNTPRTFAVFLCLPFCAALCRHFIMAGCFGQSSGWLATNDQYFHPTTTRRPSRGKLERRLIPFIRAYAQ